MLFYTKACFPLTLLHKSLCLSVCQIDTMLIIVILLRLEIMRCKSSNFVLFQDCVGYSSYFAVSHKIYNHQISPKTNTINYYNFN